MAWYIWREVKENEWQKYRHSVFRLLSSHAICFYDFISAREIFIAHSNRTFLQNGIPICEYASANILDWMADGCRDEWIATEIFIGAAWSEWQDTNWIHCIIMHFSLIPLYYSLWRSWRDCITVTVSSTNLSITFYYLLENQRIRRALFFEMPFDGKPSNAQLQDTSTHFDCIFFALYRSFDRFERFYRGSLSNWILMENWNSYIIITYKIIGIVMYVRASRVSAYKEALGHTPPHRCVIFFSSVIYFIYFSFSFYLQFIERQHQNRHIPLCARLKANFIYASRAAHSLPPFHSQCLHIRMHLHMHNLYIINALKTRSEKCIGKKQTKQMHFHFDVRE